MNLFLFWVFALVGGGGALIEEQTMQRMKRFKFVFLDSEIDTRMYLKI